MTLLIFLCLLRAPYSWFNPLTSLFQAKEVYTCPAKVYTVYITLPSDGGAPLRPGCCAASPQHSRAASPQHSRAASPPHSRAASPPHYHTMSPQYCRAASPPHCSAVSPPHSCAAVLSPLHSDRRAAPLPHRRVAVLLWCCRAAVPPSCRREASMSCLCAQCVAILSLLLRDHRAESAMHRRAVVPLLPNRDRKAVPLSRHSTHDSLQKCDD